MQPVYTGFNSAFIVLGGSCPFLRWRPWLLWTTVEASNAAKHPIVHRTAPRDKGGLSAPNVIFSLIIYFSWLCSFLKHFILAFILIVHRRNVFLDLVNDINEGLFKILCWFLNQLFHVSADLSEIYFVFLLFLLRISISKYIYCHWCFSFVDCSLIFLLNF